MIVSLHFAVKVEIVTSFVAVKDVLLLSAK